MDAVSYIDKQGTCPEQRVKCCVLFNSALDDISWVCFSLVTVSAPSPTTHCMVDSLPGGPPRVLVLTSTNMLMTSKSFSLIQTFFQSFRLQYPNVY